MPLFLAVKVSFGAALEEIIKRNALCPFYSVYVVGQRKLSTPSFSPSGVQLKCHDEHPRSFHMGVHPGFDSLCMACTISGKYDHLEEYGSFVLYQ